MAERRGELTMVIINGMEMPESCADCLFVDYFKRQWYCKAINDSIDDDVEKRSSNCPLFQIVMEKPIVFKDGEIVENGN